MRNELDRNAKFLPSLLLVLRSRLGIDRLLRPWLHRVQTAPARQRLRHAAFQLEQALSPRLPWPAQRSRRQAR